MITFLTNPTRISFIAVLSKGLLIIISFASSLASATTATDPSTRSIFLNGKDISGARSTDMKNVTVHINEQGDLYIIGPQYQVSEEDTYVPLRKYVQGLSQPDHKDAAQASDALKVGKTQTYSDGTTAKAGDSSVGTLAAPTTQGLPTAPGAPAAKVATAAQADGTPPATNPPGAATNSDPSGAVSDGADPLEKPGTKIEP